MPTLIVVLLVLSAVAELFGTVTVWSNYSRGAALAERILEGVEQEQLAAAQIPPGLAALRQVDPEVATFAADAATTALRQFRADVGQFLKRQLVVTAGLYSYAGGAVLGLAAGLVAIYR
jgi:hypothetical protein